MVELIICRIMKIKKLIITLFILVVVFSLSNKLAFSQNEGEKENDPAKICREKGLTGLEFRKCLIDLKFNKFQRKLEKFSEFGEKMKEMFDKMVKESSKAIETDGEVFFLGPVSNALAKGKVKEYSSSTLVVSVKGFTVSWDVSLASIVPSSSELKEGDDVAVLGEWDGTKFVAKTVIKKGAHEVKVEEEHEEENHGKLPAPVPVLLKQIIEALRAKGIEVNIPQR